MTTTESDMRIEIGADAYTDICDTVEKICREFPAEYWRELEDRPLGDRSPASFVAALGGAGIMAALVPEAYDGAGLPLEAAAAIIETIHATGCNAALPIQQFRLTALLAGAAKARDPAQVSGWKSHPAGVRARRGGRRRVCRRAVGRCRRAVRYEDAGSGAGGKRRHDRLRARKRYG